MNDFIVGAIVSALIIVSGATLRGCIEVTENTRHVFLR